MQPQPPPPPIGNPPPQQSIAVQVFLGLVLFFIVLPLGTCVACSTCAGVAAVGNQNRSK